MEWKGDVETKSTMNDVYCLFAIPMYSSKPANQKWNSDYNHSCLFKMRNMTGQTIYSAKLLTKDQKSVIALSLGINSR